MNKFLQTVVLIFGCFTFGFSFLYADESFRPEDFTYLIRSYDFDSVSGMYQEKGYGSAFFVRDNQVVTNAHVVLNSNKDPYGNYVLCINYDSKKAPKCNYALKLIRYDLQHDLAVLGAVDVLTNEKVILNPQQINIPWIQADPSLGSTVKVYGYPQNGGDTITMTQGKFSGYIDNEYKIDANIDSGNSGGAAFNDKNEFIGIPYAVASGYTSLAYVIPSSTVYSFLSDRDQGIRYDSIDQEFLSYVVKRFKRFSQSRSRIKEDLISFSLPSTFRLSTYLSHINQKDNFLYQYQSRTGHTQLSVARMYLSSKSLMSENDTFDTVYDLMKGYLSAYDVSDWTYRRDVLVGNTTALLEINITHESSNAYVQMYVFKSGLIIGISGDDQYKYKKERDDLLNRFAKNLKLSPQNSTLATRSEIEMGLFKYNLSEGDTVLHGWDFAQQEYGYYIYHKGHVIYVDTSSSSDIFGYSSLQNLYDQLYAEKAYDFQIFQKNNNFSYYTLRTDAMLMLGAISEKGRRGQTLISACVTCSDQSQESEILQSFIGNITSSSPTLK